MTHPPPGTRSGRSGTVRVLLEVLVECQRQRELSGDLGVEVFDVPDRAEVVRLAAYAVRIAEALDKKARAAAPTVAGLEEES